MKGIFRDTLLELRSRKVLYLFAFVTLVMFLGIWVTGEIGDDITFQAGQDFEMEELIGPLGPWIAYVFSKIMMIFVFLAVLSIVGLIPVSLEKGRAEYYLSKPASRSRLLISRLWSIWIVYGLVLIACGVITYGFTAVVHGVFEVSILYLFAIYWLDFLVWLSIAGLAGVLFGTTAGAMLSVFMIWVAQTLLAYHDIINQLVSSKPLNYLIDFFYYTIPKSGEIGDIAVGLAIGRGVDTWMPLWSSLLFALVMFYLADRVFKRRDY